MIDATVANKFAVMCRKIKIELRGQGFNDRQIATIIAGISSELLDEAKFGN